MQPYNPRLKQLARKLRSSQTQYEERLWRRLRRKQVCGVQFYRQRPIGEYIVDFVAPSCRLVVEVDGTQHLEAAAKQVDAERSEVLESQGFRVLRVANEDVAQNIEGVVEVLEQLVRERIG